MDGSNREIIFRRTKDQKNKNTFKLESGSLFIMGGCSQKYYTHEIPRSDSDDVRYSLTFRQFNM